MEIIDLKDENRWRDFLTVNPGESGAEFLASFNWAKILVGEKKTVKCLAALDKDRSVLSLIFLVKKSLGAGFCYWYAPRGPIFKIGLLANEIEDIINLFILEIKKIEKKAVFLKIEPAQFLNGFWQVYDKTKFEHYLNIQPKKTLVLNLKKTEAELLKEMHQKTRYNINLAIKKGVSIIEGGEADFSEFWRLMELTGLRDGFRIHDKKHYQNLISEGAKNEGFIKLFFAEYNSRKIATALICCFGGKVTYLHGASDNEFRNIIAPYLLQWEMIKRAQVTGATLYDFYGIDEKKWPGVTRFKLGFGGEERNYPGVFDIVFKSMVYKIYNLAKKVKRSLK
jgi:lipid II:glycine glycyltransferase (peptidoglycan interpeptide bridge formation enzyme)